MKAYQLVSAISPALRQEILQYVQKEANQSFIAALIQIGAQRKLRPQYFQNKSREEKAQWLNKQLELKMFDSFTEQILQLWLLKAKVPMLTAFLDATGIEHDGQGQVNDLPAEIEKSKVEEGVAAMLKDNDAEAVALYLHLFQSQRPGGWASIAEVLENDEKLKLKAAA